MFTNQKLLEYIKEQKRIKYLSFEEIYEESVAINELHVDTTKLHIEVNDNTLRIYLEGAKDFPGNEKIIQKGIRKLILYTVILLWWQR
jgi:hypothetical protein